MSRGRYLGAVHVDPDALQSIVDALGAVELAEHDLSQVVDDASVGVTTLMGATGTGVMLADDDAVLRYVSATDPVAARLEEIQEQTGVGPCIDCVVANELVITQDLTADDRWPLVGRALAGAGVRSLIGAPVLLGGAPIGSLNVYDAEPGRWDDSDLHAAGVLAASFSALLEQAVRVRSGDRLVDQLQRALDHRVVIERAVGYLMATLGVDTIEAFNRLRTRARNERAPVADVATRLLAERPDTANGW